MAGFFKYNDKLEDFAESTIEKYLDGMDKVNAELVNKIAKDKLSPEKQIDLDMLRDWIDLDMLRLERIVPQQLNPLLYNEIILNSVRGLLNKDFAPLDARRDERHGAAQGPPELHQNGQGEPQDPAQGIHRRGHPPVPFHPRLLPERSRPSSSSRRARRQKRSSRPSSPRPCRPSRITASSSKAISWPARRAISGWAKRIRRMIQLTIGGSIMLNELGARAKADTTNIRNEMFKNCFAYYKIMDPEFDIERPPANLTQEQQITKVINHVLNRFRGPRPPRNEDFLPRIQEEAKKLKDFITSKGLLDVPENLPVIEVMPRHMRFDQLVQLVYPAPYDQNDNFKLYVNPYAEMLPPDKAQSFNEEYSNMLIPIWTAEKIFPGAFAPAAVSWKNSSLIQKLSPNKALNAGWPLYAQDMFVFAGFNDYDLRQRLMELKLKLRALINFTLDISIHEGSSTKEQAIRYLTEHGIHHRSRGRARVEHDRDPSARSRLRLHRLPGDPGHGEGLQGRQGRRLLPEGIPPEADELRLAAAPVPESQARLGQLSVSPLPQGIKVTVILIPRE